MVMRGAFLAIRKVSAPFAMWLAVGIASAVGCLRTPLLQVLGYEVAAAHALLGSLAGATLAAVASWDARAHRTRAPLAAAWHGGKRAIAVVLIPIIAIWARGLVYPTCDGWQAGMWLGLLTFPSTALGACWGACAGYAALTGTRGRGGRGLAFGCALALWLAVAALALWRVYTHPTSMSFSPWIGYFPGNLYDEYVAAPTALGWARLEQLLWTLLGLGLCEAYEARAASTQRVATVGAAPRAGRMVVLGAIGASMLAYHSGALGYRVTAPDIAAALGGHYETAHFVIYYARTPEIEARIDEIATEHEFRLAQAQTAMGAAEPREKIHSYYFATPGQRAQWFGARYTEMARPWQRQIFLAHAPLPHPSLRHELAHVVAGQFGDPWFAVSARRVMGMPLMANPGMIEGSAVMADWPGSSTAELTPHQATAVLQRLGWAPSVRQLMSLAFFGAASAQGYTAAGSLVMYIRERFGVAAWQAMYRNGGDPSAALGVSLEQLETDWRGYLATLPLPDGAVDAVRERFSRPSVFARHCPHDAARMSESLRQGTATSPSVDRQRELLHRLCDLAPSADTLMALADWSLHWAPDLAPGYYYQLARDPTLDTAHRAEAYWALAILRLPNPELARTLVAEAMALRLPLVWQRRITMLRAIIDADPAVTTAMEPRLRAELDGRVSARPLPPLPTTGGPAWLLPYLRARLAALRSDDAQIVETAQAALVTVRDPLYRPALARWLIEAAWHVGDMGGFDAGLAVLAESEASPMDRLYGQDWAARRAFYRARQAQNRYMPETISHLLPFHSSTSSF